MMSLMNGLSLLRVAVRSTADVRQGQADIQHRLRGYRPPGKRSRDLEMLTSAADENTTLNDCFREKKDWRACKDEVR